MCQPRGSRDDADDDVLPAPDADADLSAISRARRANPVAARPRPAARDAPYHYYVIDDFVSAARRQGACRDA